jgi:hypothetical protein
MTVTQFALVTPLPLAALLIAAAGLAYCSGGSAESRLFLTGLLLGLAVAARISLIASLAAALILIAVEQRRRPLAILAAGSGGLLGMGLPFLWPLLKEGRENIFYDVVLIQLLRGGDPALAGSPGNKIAAITGLLSHYPAAIVLALLGVALAGLSCDRKVRFLLTLGLVQVVIYYFSSSTIWPHYHLEAMPLFCGVAGAAAPRLIRRPRHGLPLALILLILWIVPMGVSLRRLPPRLPPAKSPSHAAVAGLASSLRLVAPPGSPVLAFELNPLVEAGLRPLPGMEMAYIGYVPQWDDRTCRQRRVVNDRLIVELIEEGLPEAVLLSEMEFEIFARHQSPGHAFAAPSAAGLDAARPTIDPELLQRAGYRFRERFGDHRFPGSWFYLLVKGD